MNVAIVTGASRGIGAGIAQRLLKAGWQVYGLCRSVCQGGIKHVAVDFSEPKKVRQVTVDLLKSLPQVDLLVCAAGMGRFGSIENFSVEQIEQLMRVNFSSHAAMLSVVVPVMKRARAGKIIAIGSESALNGAVQGSIYCASKFALRGMMQSLRLSCRSAGIAVSMVHPGLVDTAFFDELGFSPGANPGNVLQVDDVCDAVDWLVQSPAHAVVEEVTLQPIQPAVVKTRSFVSDDN